VVDTQPGGGERPTVLVLSFSPIRRDARVLKQVRLLEENYRVVTCGYESAPSDAVEHLEIPSDAVVDNPYGRFVSLRQYSLAYWRLAGVRWARRALAARRFDVIIANDVQAVPVAISLRPRAGVLADLHEYWPRLHEENPAWMRWISPYYRWMCRKYVRRADAVTTVSPGLAREYEREFGFETAVVTNATPYADLQPTEVGSPLRLVHSGAGLRNRDLGLMIDAVNRSSADVTLDLYLTPNHPDYLDELRRRADESDRVRLRDAVPYDELVSTLNAYDVGVFVLPPVNFSYAHALPNKFFDFVQARLGVIVGPSPELGPTVRKHGLGVVATGWDVEALTKAVDELTPDDVREFKRHADEAASALSAEQAVDPWRVAVERLLAAGGR
jgi:Glycosyltransferase Family 4